MGGWYSDTRGFRLQWSILLSAALLLSIPTVLLTAGPAPSSEETRPDRIVAIGDLHGDLQAAQRALRLAGAAGDDDRWVGGELVLVQTGDILGRGDSEREILDLFLRLKLEAQEAGGAVHMLNGNHEMMNVLHDFRYVTSGAMTAFDDVPGVRQAFDEARAGGDSLILSLPEERQVRAAAFKPGGPVARTLADHPVAIRIGTAVFTHAGIRPRYATLGLDELNRQCREWLLGKAKPPEWIGASKGPMWSRDFSDEVDDDDCGMIARTLEILGARHKVIGHTVHDGITSYCDGRIWCIDTGMSSAYGGDVQVLEICDGEFRVLTE